MLRIRISNEALTDIFTPGVVNPNRCANGLPRNVTLMNVKYEKGLIEMLFDDGNWDSIEDVPVKFESVRHLLKDPHQL